MATIYKGNILFTKTQHQFEIIENGYFDLILICENGTRIHLYAITAGGYNIQCLHTRILVKKLKG